MFMHSCLCAMCFHARRRISTVCLHVCFISIYGLKKNKKTRPWGPLLPGLIGMLIMSLWVGYQCVCVCVCERFMTYLKRHRMTAGVLSSSPSCSDTPVARGRSFAQLKRDRQPGIWASAYRTDPSPNKTLQHVCGNEEPCLCMWVICQWPLPLVC